MKILIIPLCFFLITATTGITAEPETLTLDDCLSLALRQNPTIKKAQIETRKAYDSVTESRSKMMPHLDLNAQTANADDNSPDPTPDNPGLGTKQTSPWTIQAEATQLLFAGGRAHNNYQNALLLGQATDAAYNSVVADIMQQVRTTFYQVLLNSELVKVREQSIKLLEQQLEEEKYRMKAGTVTEFNVLRADVELANAKPHLIRAQNALRLAKESLVKLLAIEKPGSRKDFTAMIFAGTLEFKQADWDMETAMQTAMEQRPEIVQTAKAIQAANKAVSAVRSEYSPEISLFGNYGVANYTAIGTESDTDLKSWTAGVRASWSIFDGMLTQGRVSKARASLMQTELDADEAKRAIELEVRTAYSDYVQALELIDAQRKTVEQAEESLRMAKSNNQAGTGTQLDVMNAQTALTEARSNSAEVLYEYNVAITRLERATGTTSMPKAEKK
jgi:outer membrane protein